MNPDFADMLSALSEAGVDFLIVGAHALAAHGVPRATGDLDVEDLTTPDTVFQMGLPPARIDILSGITGVRFEDAWERRMVIPLAGRSIAVFSKVDFVTNKTALGRPKDLADMAMLNEAGQD